MKILALDLTLTGAGVARLRGVVAGAPQFETETVSVPVPRVPGARPGKMKNGETMKGAERLKWWRDWLIEEIQDGAELVVIEDLAYHAPSAAHAAKLYGVLELACHERGLPPIVYVNLSTVKKWATGMGKADKQRMIDTAVARFGEQVHGEHEADAVWLASYVFEKGAPEL